MTITSQVTKVSANGNGVATVFSFSPFVVYEETDIQVVTKVIATGVETPITLGTGATNFSVTVAAYPGTGSITYPASGGTPLPAGSAITIYRTLPLEQTLNLENQGGYFPDLQEVAFDKLTVMDLQQQDSIDRSLKVPVSSALVPVLPAIAVDGAVLAWDGTTGLVKSGPTTASLAAEAAAAAASAAAASTSASSASTSETAAAASASAASTSAGDAATSAAATNFRWTFDSATVMADPGTGDIMFNSATVASVTQIAVSALTGDSGNPDISDFIITWDDSVGTPRGTLVLRRSGVSTTFAIFSITGAITDNGTWLQIPVTHVTSSGAWSAGNIAMTHFTRAGADGSGAVATVAGTAPIASSGGANPVISLNDAGVTYAKIQNVTVTDRLLGRATAGAGVVEEITLTAAGRALLDDANAAAQLVTLGAVSAVTGTAPIASSGGATPAISLNDDGVTYAKIQNVTTTDRILGRVTAGAGDIEEIVCTAAARTVLDDATTTAMRATLGTDVATNLLSGTVPTARLGGGTANNTTFLRGDQTWSASGSGFTLGTAVATTSGTSFTFGSIPAGIKQIIISFQGVSLSGTNDLLVQIGDSGGIETTGYISASESTGSTIGFIINNGVATDTISGHMILTLLNASTFLWVEGQSLRREANRELTGGGDKALSAELTQLKLLPTGADTFDAGSVNIMYI